MPRATLTTRSLFLGIAMCALILSALAEKQPPAKPVNINQATVAELQQVPEIGPRIAEAIVHLREKSGPYKRIDDLLAAFSHKR